ncbi:MAG: DUF2513 domain-containing protein [Bacteroidetes bacterium]|nr:DUF2513 domain-containing protein [Bacteroidota bacterium]
MKLVRHLLVLILNYVEDHQDRGPYDVPTIDGFTDDQIQYHIRMCEEAGWLLPGEKMNGNGMSKYIRIGELTWNGHQHLARYKGQ